MTKRKNKPFPVGSLLLSTTVTLLVLLTGFMLMEDVDGGMVLKRLLIPLLRLSGFIALGLFVGQAVEAAGFTRYLSLPASKLFNFANLGKHCGAAFTTAFFSGTAANAMLMNYYKDGIICKKQLYLTNLINHVPAYFLHFPTTFFIVIPLTGKAGVYYFGLTFSALVLRSCLFVLFGKLHPDIRECGLSVETVDGEPKEKKTKEPIFQAVLKKLPRRLARVLIFVVPIYVVIFMVNILGFFDAMQEAMAGYVVSAFIPVESLSIVILGFVAEFSSGFAAAGALMEAGTVTAKQAAVALLIGNIIAFPIRALRHQVPRYMGIFEPRMGLQILLLGQGCRIISLAITGYVFYLVW